MERIRLCTILGLVIAALAPLVSMIDGSGVPWIVRSYFFPSYNYFGFFPWASFLGLRNGGRKHNPRCWPGRPATRHALDNADRRRDGDGRADTIELALLGLPEERILAE